MSGTDSKKKNNTYVNAHTNTDADKDTHGLVSFPFSVLENMEMSNLVYQTHFQHKQVGNWDWP